MYVIEEKRKIMPTISLVVPNDLRIESARIGSTKIVNIIARHVAAKHITISKFL
jgi:hypothetical protein